MTITVESPDAVANYLAARGEDIPRVALEAFAVESYRSGTLTQAQLRLLLGYQTRMEVDGFLKAHGVALEYSLEDFDREGEITRRAREQRPHDVAPDEQDGHQRLAG